MKYEAWLHLLSLLLLKVFFHSSIFEVRCLCLNITKKRFILDIKNCSNQRETGVSLVCPLDCLCKAQKTHCDISSAASMNVDWVLECNR